MKIEGISKRILIALIVVVILSWGMSALAFAKSLELTYTWETGMITTTALGKCSAKDGNSVQQNIILKSRIRESGYKNVYMKIIKLKIDDKLTIKDLMINTGMTPDQLQKWIVQNTHFEAIKFKSSKKAVSSVYINGADLANYIKHTHYAWLKKVEHEQKDKQAAELKAAHQQEALKKTPANHQKDKTAIPAPTTLEVKPEAIAPQEKPAVATTVSSKPVYKSEPNSLTLVVEEPLSPNKETALDERTKLATLSALEKAKLELTRELGGAPFMGLPSFNEWAGANPELAKVNWNEYFSVERVKINNDSTKVEVLVKLDLKSAKSDIRKKAKKMSAVKKLSNR